MCGASAGSTVGLFQGMALQESASGTQDFSSGLVHSQKINDMSFDQLISHLSSYEKKLTQRSDDSINLRHMDDVAGTGPDERTHEDQAVFDDVVVLRKERDTVNFSGLQITKTSQGFGVRNGTQLVEFLVNLNPGRRSTVMELATAILLDGHDYSNFRTAVDKSWHFGDQICNSPPTNYPHKSSIPQQRASAQ